MRHEFEISDDHLCLGQKILDVASTKSASAENGRKRRNIDRSISPIDQPSRMWKANFGTPWERPDILSVEASIPMVRAVTPLLSCDRKGSLVEGLAYEHVAGEQASPIRHPPFLSSRSSKVRPEVASGFQEIVFDSRSVGSSSQGSVQSSTSCASGRRGPLSELARIGMKAVKKLGACWRYKL